MHTLLSLYDITRFCVTVWMVTIGTLTRAFSYDAKASNLRWFKIGQTHNFTGELGVVGELCLVHHVFVQDRAPCGWKPKLIQFFITLFYSNSCIMQSPFYNLFTVHLLHTFYCSCLPAAMTVKSATLKTYSHLTATAVPDRCPQRKVPNTQRQSLFLLAEVNEDEKNTNIPQSRPQRNVQCSNLPRRHQHHGNFGSWDDIPVPPKRNGRLLTPNVLSLWC